MRRNITTKHPVSRDVDLTTSIDVAAQASMRERYSSHWYLDDAVLQPQSALETNRNKRSCIVPSHHRPSSQIETPIAPWGIVFAYLALLASLGFLFVAATLGGFDLG